MHGPVSYYDKLKVTGAKLTRHRNVRSNTKTALNMFLRPRKAKAEASSDLLDQDGSAPHNSKPVKYKRQKSHKEMGYKEIVNDIQDSDQEMEDSNQESDEDEGSLYAPTEATSELGEEKSNEYEGTMKPPPMDSCMFLVLLPRELRDKIYEHIMTLESSLSDNKSKFKCMYCPEEPAIPSYQSQLYGARNFLRTCHQIHDEGIQIFYEVNSWTLHRARLREAPIAHSSATIRDTQRRFDRIRRTKANTLFKHVNMHITLCPLAYCDYHVPDSVALDDPVAVLLFERSRDSSVIAYHKLDETAQCELFRAAVNGLVVNQTDVFPRLRSITLKVSLHAKNSVPDVLNKPLDRCGITFYVRIKLGRQGLAIRKHQYNASLQSSAPGGVINDLCHSQHVEDEAHNEVPDTSILDDSWVLRFLDPRRRMLSPLKQLLDVQSVEVERRWTVRYRQHDVENGNAVIRAQPLRRMWRFRTVGEMLEGAGAGFGEFLDPALEYLGTSLEDVVEIKENTAKDIEHQLIP